MALTEKMIMIWSQKHSEAESALRIIVRQGYINWTFAHCPSFLSCLSLNNTSEFSEIKVTTQSFPFRAHSLTNLGLYFLCAFLAPSFSSYLLTLGKYRSLPQFSWSFIPTSLLQWDSCWAGTLSTMRIQHSLSKLFASRWISAMHARGHRWNRSGLPLLSSPWCSQVLFAIGLALPLFLATAVHGRFIRINFLIILMITIRRGSQTSPWFFTLLAKDLSAFINARLLNRTRHRN